MASDACTTARQSTLLLPLSAEDEKLLDRLPYAAHASFDHYSREGDALCLPGTRMQILADIMAWARGEPRSALGSSSPRIYWLNGMAGTGKSTIARTVARRCADEGHLGASFFFSRGGGELETARKLVTSIAVQLARLSPSLKRHVCDAVAERPNIAEKALRDQWKQLVLRPLQKLSGHTHATPTHRAIGAPVIVIDALDECRDEREIGFVLQLLSDTAGLAVAALKIFLTSRPEVSVREGMHDVPPAEQRHYILHHVQQSIVDHDIRIFFEKNLGEVIRKRCSQADPLYQDILQELVVKAGGLFIWAATTCRFVRQGGLRALKRLDSILTNSMSTAAASPERKLDEIYVRLLGNSLREDFTLEESDEVCSLLRTVLGSIAVMFSSLSAATLDALLNLVDYKVPDVLSDLHSIVDVPSDPSRPIRLQHASVRDFLLCKQRCTDARFWVDQQWAHAHLANHCLRLMSHDLHNDICGLRTPDARISDIDVAVMARCIPPHLRYACRYWVPHLCQSHNTHGLKESIYQFIQTHFLHWLEVLSLLDSLDDGVEMLGDLEGIVVRSPSLTYYSKRKTVHEVGRETRTQLCRL